MRDRRLTKLADQIAAKIVNGNGGVLTEEQLRDYIDIWTGSRFDYEPLNILTDMVQSRINKAQSSKGKHHA